MKENYERHSDNRFIFARRSFRPPVVSLPGASTHANISRLAATSARSKRQRDESGGVAGARDTRCFISIRRTYYCIVSFSLVFCYFFYFFVGGQPLSRGARFRLSRRAAQSNQSSVHPRARRSAPSKAAIPFFVRRLQHPTSSVLFSCFLSVCIFASCSQIWCTPTRAEARRSRRVAQPWMGSGSLGDGVAVPLSLIHI